MTDSQDSSLNNIIAAANAANPDNPELAKLAAAQAVVESGNGKSTLASVHNNYFGIKGEGDAGSINLPTKEFVNGKYVDTKAAFRAYTSPEASFADHTAFLQANPRYKSVLAAKSFPEMAQAIASAGYATDPTYAQKLIDVYNSRLAPHFGGQAVSAPGKKHPPQGHPHPHK